MNDTPPDRLQTPIAMEAYLTCERCQVVLHLGQVAWRSRHAGQISHFRCSASMPSSSDRRLSRAVWTFLADHMGHPMRVLLEHQLPEAAVEIGGAGPEAITIDSYLAGFEG